jgi:ketosteroid isomerase-like protein
MNQSRRRASSLLLGAVIAVVSGSACGHALRTSAGAPPGDVVALLKRQTQELMDAVAPGKAEVWQRYLLDDAVYLDENGVVYDKAALLKELTPLPEGLVGRIEVDRFQVKLHGDTAVAAAEIQEYLDYHGQQLRTRFRFVDTWLRTPDGWRLAARHTAAVLKDPPAVSLSAEELCAYAGEYRLTPAITTTVRCTKDGLIAERSGRPPATYLPEVRDVFFVAGQPRSRRIFTRDAAGAVTGFVDRREGEDVRWQKSR